MNLIAERWNETGQIVYPFAEDSVPALDGGILLPNNAILDLTFVDTNDVTPIVDFRLLSVHRAGASVTLNFSRGQITTIIPTVAVEVEQETEDWLLRLAVGPGLLGIPDGSHTVISGGQVDRARVLDYRRYRVLSVAALDTPATQLVGDIVFEGRNGIAITNARSRNAVRFTVSPGAGTGYPCAEFIPDYDRDEFVATYDDTPFTSLTLTVVPVSGPPVTITQSLTGASNRERVSEFINSVYEAVTLPMLLSIYQLPRGTDGGAIVFAFTYASVVSVSLSNMQEQTAVTPTTGWSTARQLVFSTSDRVVQFSVSIRSAMFLSAWEKELPYVARAVQATVPGWDPATHTIELPVLGDSLTTLRAQFLALGSGFTDLVRVGAVQGVTPFMTVPDEATRLSIPPGQRNQIVLQADTAEAWQWLSAGAVPITVTEGTPVTFELVDLTVDEDGFTEWGLDVIPTLQYLVTDSPVAEVNGVYYLPPGGSGYVKGTLTPITVPVDALAVAELPEIEPAPGDPVIKQLEITSPDLLELEGVYYLLPGDTEYIKGDLDTSGPIPTVLNQTHLIIPTAGSWSIQREDGTPVLQGTGADPWDVTEWGMTEITVTAITHRLESLGTSPYDWRFTDVDGRVIATGRSPAASPDSVTAWDYMIRHAVLSGTAGGAAGDYFATSTDAVYRKGVLDMAGPLPDVTGVTHALTYTDGTSPVWELVDVTEGTSIASAFGLAPEPWNTVAWFAPGTWIPATLRTASEAATRLDDQFGLPIPLTPSRPTILALGTDPTGQVSCESSLLQLNGQSATEVGELNLQGIRPLRIVPEPATNTLYVEADFNRASGGTLECWACLEDQSNA